VSLRNRWRIYPQLPSGLDGISPGLRACLAFDVTTISETTVRDVVAEVPEIVRNRLSPLALELLRRSTFPVDATALEALRDDTFRRCMHTLELQRRTAPALSLLGSNGIDFLVLKGPVAAQFYNSPSQRPYSDIDILVRPEDYPRAISALRAQGYAPSDKTRPPRDWFQTYCVEGMNLRSDDGGAIDVHHHLAPWAFTTDLSFSTLENASERARIADVPVKYVSPQHSALIAALHLMNDLWKGDRSLVTWRDLIWLWNRCDYQALVQAFDEASLAWYLPYVNNAVVSLGASVSSTRRRLKRRYFLKYVRLNALGWNHSSIAVRHPAGWAIRLPFLRGLAYLGGWLVPSRPFVNDRHGGYVRYWRDILRSIRQVIGGDDLRPAATVEKAVR